MAGTVEAAIPATLVGFVGSDSVFTWVGGFERGWGDALEGFDRDDGLDDRGCIALSSLLQRDSGTANVVTIIPLRFEVTAVSGSSGLSSLLIAGLVIVISNSLYSTTVGVKEE